MLLALLIAPFTARTVYGQETVFDVRSADILDKGKVYGKADGTARPVDPVYTFTPRVVVGIGHQIEIGANYNGLTTPRYGRIESLTNDKVASVECRQDRMVVLCWRRPLLPRAPAIL
jgi:hypothetical protein